MCGQRRCLASANRGHLLTEDHGVHSKRTKKAVFLMFCELFVI